MAQPAALQQSGRCLLSLQDAADVHLQQKQHGSFQAVKLHLLRNMPDPSEPDWVTDNMLRFDEQSANRSPERRRNSMGLVS